TAFRTPPPSSPRPAASPRNSSPLAARCARASGPTRPCSPRSLVATTASTTSPRGLASHSSVRSTQPPPVRPRPNELDVQLHEATVEGRRYGIGLEDLRAQADAEIDVQVAEEIGHQEVHGVGPAAEADGQVGDAGAGDRQCLRAAEGAVAYQTTNGEVVVEEGDRVGARRRAAALDAGACVDREVAADEERRTGAVGVDEVVAGAEVEGEVAGDGGTAGGVDGAGAEAEGVAEDLVGAAKEVQRQVAADGAAGVEEEAVDPGAAVEQDAAADVGAELAV